MIDRIPPELLLDGYPESMRAIAERLRAIVRRAVPEATEAVRLGWRLIGYDIAVARRSIFFAYVAPEPEHVHLGFHYGVFMDDPAGLLTGAGVTRLARWLTFRPPATFDEIVLAELIQEGARVARMSRWERLSRTLDREAEDA